VLSIITNNVDKLPTVGKINHNFIFIYALSVLKLFIGAKNLFKLFIIL